MNWLSNWFSVHRPHAANPRTPVPAVERLETRNVLSTAVVAVPPSFAVATGILNSQESFTDFVSAEYTLLRRSPDQAGLNNWVGAMERGMSQEAVEANFAGSAEYFSEHGSDNTLWLQGVYQDLLGRPIDPAGLQHWLGKLASGESRVGVASEIATSSERDGIIVQADYAQFLGRSANSGEVAFWTSQLQQGETRGQLAVQIVASNEFFADAHNDPSTFISHTYQDALHRSPSSGELSYWLNVYQQHQSNGPISR